MFSVVVTLSEEDSEVLHRHREAAEIVAMENWQYNVR